MKNIRLQFYAIILSLFAFTACEQVDEDLREIRTADFENLTTGSSFFWNGSDGTGQFISNGMTFGNNYNTTYSSWDGFAYSQKTDYTTADVSNQYSVFNPANSTNKFAIYYPSYFDEVYASFPSGVEHVIKSISVCNSTYAALAIKNGYGNMSKKFGGATGNDKDWFKLTVVGFNAAGDSVKSVDFFLADYRFDNNASDIIINKWTTVDLTPLTKINKISFRFSSTDNGGWGMNNPAYVCVDNIKYEVITPR